MPMRDVAACRHLCQEARVVLTSLRGGPPHVARGDLAQDLMDLRTRVREEETPRIGVVNKEQEEEEKEKPTTSAPASSKSGGGGGGGEQIPTSSHSAPPQPKQQQQQPLTPYARPFLQVIMDPRASGPHTLVTLRAIYRLLQQETLQQFGATTEELCVSVLACKFEQTDAGADEAVEMAIADVLSLLVQLDESAAFDGSSPMRPETFLDAFNTVFVTRNTFVHSPALCYHFEDVLSTMVETVCSKSRSNASQNTVNNSSNNNASKTKTAARGLLEFLVNQLLHTPLVGGEGLDESTREAQLTHDDTRTLCLRLTQIALRTIMSNGNDDNSNSKNNNYVQQDPELLRIIQDDLCLSLLMTGQAIWAYHDHAHHTSPGFVSLEVLSEICATLAILWNTVELRNNLVAQFETILTGFYTRALVLLRKRKQPVNSLSFNANLIFDAEAEIILESLVDILCLHDHRHSIADGDGGSLETMFAFYDCHMNRSDVATELFVELCRCCGGSVNEDGEAALMTPSTSVGSLQRAADSRNSSDGGGGGGGPSSSAPESLSGASAADEGGTTTNAAAAETSMVRVEHPWRQVPAHLKELCAQALMGGMKCLFRDDNASAETMLERSKRKRSIMLRQMEHTLSDDIDNDEESNIIIRTGQQHVLRDLKSKKRLMRKAARIFNKKASRGIEFLLDSGLVSDPVKPEAIAAFLRNGIVVGLDKKAVGAYLGEAGKAPAAGKSPPCWERDWFHKDVLKAYCALFRFDDQSLLDGLRMFLACFRLPGEAQQIDRILQAFSDTCSKVCEESSQRRLKLFSPDPKRASDAAYLLSFSIIMLNTDRHNTNIREDRKMSCDDFVKVNTDYGRDITDKGKEFPREFLAGIYESINEEEIRTEGEGADGAMTIERWKDVLRGSTDASEDGLPSLNDAEDLTELVLEHVWKPIVSAIGALWDMHTSRTQYMEPPANPADSAQGNMLGVQGARLGMDMSIEMLNGVRQLGRVDIFRKIFLCICDYTGLLGEYTQDAVDRTWAFTNSLESQAATVVAIRTAIESVEELDEECWKRVWSMLFELRDLKLIAKGKTGINKSLLYESDSDFLTEMARIDWTICLEKGDMDYSSRAAEEQSKEKGGGLFSAFGRAIFGQGGTEYENSVDISESGGVIEPSLHGKEKLAVWDEGATSDMEDSSDEGENSVSALVSDYSSPGSQFESLLIQENLDKKRMMDMPVTGLERADETRQHHVSPRARVRERLRSSCNSSAILSESRYMDEASILCLLRSLTSMVASLSSSSPFCDIVSPAPRKFERTSSDLSVSTASITVMPPLHNPMSPASEAFAEVLICELSLKNKDRLKLIWSELLQEHYLSQLTSMLVNPGEGTVATKIPVDPGLEKRVTGLLRLSICALQRGDMANEVLSAWKYLLPVNDEQHASSPLRALDRHIGEGLWRIVSQVENLASLNDDGWEGVVSLLSWCAKRGGALKPIAQHGPSGLPEDDPALQCYRSLHLFLSSKEVYEKIPCSIVLSLRCLVAAGGRRNYAQLSVASLDLLNILHEKKFRAEQAKLQSSTDSTIAESFWQTWWRMTIEAIAEAAELSPDSNIRQHALSMLTDLFMHKEGSAVPAKQLGSVLGEVCVPLAGRRIIKLQMGDPSVKTADQLMMEFDLCIGLIFKPLRHHLNNLEQNGSAFASIWQSVLTVIEELLGKREQAQEKPKEVVPENLKATMNNLASEHFQSAIKALISTGVIFTDPKTPGDITAITWESVGRMGVPAAEVEEWKKEADENAGVESQVVPEE